MMTSLHKMHLMVIAALALLAGACSPISQENYGKLKVGMSYERKRDNFRVIDGRDDARAGTPSTPPTMMAPTITP